MRHRPALGAFATLAMLLVCLCAARPVLAQTSAAGTRIENVATVSFVGSGGPTTVASNPVAAIVVPPPSQSAVTILRATSTGGATPSTAGPTFCRSSSGSLTELPPPELSGGTVVDPTSPIDLAATTTLHGGEAAFVRIEDADQNLDAGAIDVTTLALTAASGDSERLQLSETGPDTGVFVGYIQTRVAPVSIGNCVLEIERNTQISSIYVDPADAQDTSRATALVDPYGLIFDSRSGAPIDGARVRLIDASTGLPATVVGDDGVSSYPSEMITGAAVTDAGGTVYTLPPGVFRFPLVAPGSYRLEVNPPSGHAFPSSFSIAELAQTPGAPYRLSPGSYGAAFATGAAPVVAVDVPVDAVATQLFMQKSTPTAVAAVGDFVQYQLTVENTAARSAVSPLRVVDQLPPGVRYRPGSTRFGGAATADPEISPDGGTLTFTVGALGAGQRLEIRYVVEITVGARGRELVNAARAIGPDGVASNDATATIQLREELFRDRAIVMGRVVEGDCGQAASARRGISGVRVYLEDGRYSVTDDEGKYHFSDVAPGTHVVQLDTVTIPQTHVALACDNVRHAGRAYSQFVDVRGGALWRSDFVLERRLLAKGRVAVQLDTALAGLTGLHHELELSAARFAIGNARALVMLPDGVVYQRGSARLNGGALADPTITDNVLSFVLGDLAGDQRAKLTFGTEVTQGASEALVVRALGVFNSPARVNQRTGTVENTVLRGATRAENASYRFTPRSDVLDTSLEAADRRRLDRIVKEWRGGAHLHLTAVGHADDARNADRCQISYVDNYGLSHAEAQAVASYLAERLDIDATRVTVEGRGADEPLARGRDAQSRASNRRVEITIEGLRLAKAGGLTLKQANARSASVETTGDLALLSASVTPEPQAALAPASTSAPAPAQASTQAAIDVESLAPGIAWVLPEVDAAPAIPSLKVAVQHLPGQHVELSINGRPVDALNFDGSQLNAVETVSLSRWRGIELRDGNNEIMAVVRASDGQQVQRLIRFVHYAGGAVRAELVREASTLVADGRTRPVIALKMFDAAGKPARPGTLGAYRVEPPYRSWWEVESLNENKLLAVGTREPTFTVDADGLARLELEPTSQAGSAIVRLRMNERRQQEIRVWLEPQAREWIMVGLAENTAAYRTISDNMEAARVAGFEDGYAEDGRLAFFAKGAIKGEYLITAAYDSARDRELAQDRLLAAVEPDRYYTLYGDATEQRFEAATTRKLFVKLERRQFAALFGDFETGLTVTELTRYSRTLTGFKSDYAGERFGYSAFAAESEQGYVRDELPGDGTSGLYRLSRRPLIVNSDKIRLETRDRFRSEVVLDSRPLTRHLDYSVDYLNGTLFFKQPVASRDAGFNPVFIVAEYEVLNGGEEQLTAGGRAAVKLAGDRLEVGASHLHEGAATGDTRITGTDLRWQIDSATELRAEVARSDSDDPARGAQASAYLTELSHVTEHLDARVYIREQEAGFGVGQQFGSEAGTRKLGVDARYRLAKDLALEGETYRQKMLDTGARRELASAELRRETADYMLGIGARHVADRGLAGGDTRSQQAFVRGSLDLFDDLITLRASQDAALGGKDGSIDFPSRSVLGVDYHWRPETTLFAEYERARGAQLDSDMARLGARTSPWKRAQLQSSMSQQTSEYGPRVFANLGLTQGWQVSERWGVDFGIDQSRTLDGASATPLNARAPLASGSLSGDFLATFAGATYRSEAWTFTARAEHRDSDEEDRSILSGGFYREPRAGHAFSLATQWFDSAHASGTDATGGDVQLGWAYRPASSAWIVLDRLDLKYDSRSDTLGEFESARAVNNLNANRQLDAHTQLGVQFGARYVRSTFDGERYSGLSTLYGVDARRDLNSRFDVGAHGTLLSSLESSVREYSFGVDLGVTVRRNVWLSIGYNFAGFHDSDFTASRYTVDGPYLKFRVKADQDTFKDLAGWNRLR